MAIRLEGLLKDTLQGAVDRQGNTDGLASILSCLLVATLAGRSFKWDVASMVQKHEAKVKTLKTQLDLLSSSEVEELCQEVQAKAGDQPTMSDLLLLFQDTIVQKYLDGSEPTPPSLLSDLLKCDASDDRHKLQAILEKLLQPLFVGVGGGSAHEVYSAEMKASFRGAFLALLEDQAPLHDAFPDATLEQRLEDMWHAVQTSGDEAAQSKGCAWNADLVGMVLGPLQERIAQIVEEHLSVCEAQEQAGPISSPPLRRELSAASTRSAGESLKQREGATLWVWVAIGILADTHARHGVVQLNKEAIGVFGALAALEPCAAAALPRGLLGSQPTAHVLRQFLDMDDISEASDGVLSVRVKDRPALACRVQERSLAAQYLGSVLERSGLDALQKYASASPPFPTAQVAATDPAAELPEAFPRESDMRSPMPLHLSAEGGPWSIHRVHERVISKLSGIHVPCLGSLGLVAGEWTALPESWDPVELKESIKTGNADSALGQSLLGILNQADVAEPWRDSGLDPAHLLRLAAKLLVAVQGPLRGILAEAIFSGLVQCELRETIRHAIVSVARSGFEASCLAEGVAAAMVAVGMATDQDKSYFVQDVLDEWRSRPDRGGTGAPQSPLVQPEPTPVIAPPAPPLEPSKDWNPAQSGTAAPSAAEEPIHAGDTETLAELEARDELDNRALCEQVCEARGVGAQVPARPTQSMRSIHNMSKSLSVELYGAANHFLFELIQNADDNTYSREPGLQLRLEGSTLTLFNNEKGFSAKNVVSISSFCESTKKTLKHQGMIGNKGIGFKSVYAVTHQPHILSRKYNFRFDDRDICGYQRLLPLELPSEKDWNPASEGTRVTLPLDVKHPDTGILSALTVQQHLSRLQPETILFLNKLRRLQVVMHGERLVRDSHLDIRDVSSQYDWNGARKLVGLAVESGTSGAASGQAAQQGFSRAFDVREATLRTQEFRSPATVEGSCPTRDESSNVVFSQLETAGGAAFSTPTRTEEKRFIIFRHRLELPNERDSEGNPLWASIEIAFCPEDSERAVQNEQASKEKVFAYLPLCTYGMPVRVHADWAVPSARESITDGAGSMRNQEILNALPRVLVAALHALCQSDGQDKLRSGDVAGAVKVSNMALTSVPLPNVCDNTPFDCVPGAVVDTLHGPANGSKSGVPLIVATRKVTEGAIEWGFFEASKTLVLSGLARESLAVVPGPAAAHAGAGAAEDVLGEEQLDPTDDLVAAILASAEAEGLGIAHLGISSWAAEAAGVGTLPGDGIAQLLAGASKLLTRPGASEESKQRGLKCVGWCMSMLIGTKLTEATARALSNLPLFPLTAGGGVAALKDGNIYKVATSMSDRACEICEAAGARFLDPDVVRTWDSDFAGWFKALQRVPKAFMPNELQQAADLAVLVKLLIPTLGRVESVDDASVLLMEAAQCEARIHAREARIAGGEGMAGSRGWPAKLAERLHRAGVMVPTTCGFLPLDMDEKPLKLPDGRVVFPFHHDSLESRIPWLSVLDGGDAGQHYFPRLLMADPGWSTSNEHDELLEFAKHLGAADSLQPMLVSGTCLVSEVDHQAPGSGYKVDVELPFSPDTPRWIVRRHEDAIEALVNDPSFPLKEQLPDPGSGTFVTFQVQVPHFPGLTQALQRRFDPQGAAGGDAGAGAAAGGAAAQGPASSGGASGVETASQRVCDGYTALLLDLKRAWETGSICASFKREGAESTSAELQWGAALGWLSMFSWVPVHHAKSASGTGLCKPELAALPGGEYPDALNALLSTCTVHSLPPELAEVLGMGSMPELEQLVKLLWARCEVRGQPRADGKPVPFDGFFPKYKGSSAAVLDAIGKHYGSTAEGQAKLQRLPLVPHGRVLWPPSSIVAAEYDDSELLITRPQKPVFPTLPKYVSDNLSDALPLRYAEEGLCIPGLGIRGHLQPSQIAACLRAAAQLSNDETHVEAEALFIIFMFVPWRVTRSKGGANIPREPFMEELKQQIAEQEFFAPSVIPGCPVSLSNVLAFIGKSSKALLRDIRGWTGMEQLLGRLVSMQFLHRDFQPPPHGNVIVRALKTMTQTLGISEIQDCIVLTARRAQAEAVDDVAIEVKAAMLAVFKHMNPSTRGITWLKVCCLERRPGSSETGVFFDSEGNEAASGPLQPMAGIVKVLAEVVSGTEWSREAHLRLVLPATHGGQARALDHPTCEEVLRSIVCGQLAAAHESPEKVSAALTRLCMLRLEKLRDSDAFDGDATSLQGLEGVEGGLKLAEDAINLLQLAQGTFEEWRRSDGGFTMDLLHREASEIEGAAVTLGLPELLESAVAAPASRSPQPSTPDEPAHPTELQVQPEADVSWPQRPRSGPSAPGTAFSSFGTRPQRGPAGVTAPVSRSHPAGRVSVGEATPPRSATQDGTLGGTSGPLQVSEVGHVAHGQVDSVDPPVTIQIPLTHTSSAAAARSRACEEAVCKYFQEHAAEVGLDGYTVTWVNEAEEAGQPYDVKAVCQGQEDILIEVKSKLHPVVREDGHVYVGPVSFAQMEAMNRSGRGKYWLANCTLTSDGMQLLLIKHPVQSCLQDGVFFVFQGEAEAGAAARVSPAPEAGSARS